MQILSSLALGYGFLFLEKLWLSVVGCGWWWPRYTSTGSAQANPNTLARIGIHTVTVVLIALISALRGL